MTRSRTTHPTGPLGLSRRQLLRGAGVAAASVPLFNLRARAQGVKPLRLVCWPLMNGAESGYFYPGGSSAQLSMITEPIRKYASYATFIKGVSISGSGNHYAIRSTYTGANVSTYTSPDPTVKSIDQIVADHLAATAPTPLRSLHVGVIPADSLNAYQRGQSMCFFAPKPVDYEANPVTAFDRLWPGKGGGTAPTVAGPDHTGELLDLIDGEMKDLDARLGAGGASSEIAKLKQHKEALMALRPSGKGGTTPTTMMPADTGGSLPSVEKLRPLIEGNAKDAYKRDYFADLFDAQIDIMGRALSTGLTRVVTLQAGSADNNLIVPVGRGFPHHNSSHGNQATFSTVQQYYFTKMARLLALLDVPDPLDPGKTVLDNTLILMIAETLPVSHSSNGVPTLLVGGGAGKFKVGSYINAGGITNKNVNASVLKAFGLDGAQFGSTLVGGLLS